MAHKESEILSLDEKYKLDKYEFSITTRDIPQTDLMDVIATATGPNGKMGAKTTQIPKTDEIDGWYVEANSNTADCYLSAMVPSQGKPTYTTPADSRSEVYVHDGFTFTFQDFNVGDTIKGNMYNEYLDVWRTYTLKSAESKVFAYRFLSGIYSYVLFASDGKFTLHYVGPDNAAPDSSITEKDHLIIPNQGIADYTAQCKRDVNDEISTGPPGTTYYIDKDMVKFGTGQYMDKEHKDVLIGRFEIDIRLAGGTAGNGGEEPGPDGKPWEDPDDGQPTLWPGDDGYPDPEDPDYPGDDEPYYPPSKTLYLEIDGALSGRHNDPLNDTSYSYVPADKATVKPYGYGGDGGHGGGGGGGASTVIVYKFATDKADSKEITVRPKRHGYGSGGGKGGKGGDGCILIYY